MRRLCLFVLLCAACVYLTTVEQPSEVARGEQFTVRITGTADEITPPGGGTGVLGIMLPDGVHVDSGRYTDSQGHDTLIVEPDSLLQAWLEMDYPSDPYSHWEGFELYPGPYDSTIAYEVIVYARVTDSAVPYDYLVDYRVGHSYVWPTAFQFTDSILDQPMTITWSAVAEEEFSRTRSPCPSVVRASALTKLDGSVLDVHGRDVTDRRAGLSPGVYFVCPEPSAASHQPSAARKVIVTR